MRERKDELAKIIQREMGKPLDQSDGEVEFSTAIYQYYADNAEKFLADEPIDLLDGEGSALIRRSSVGVLLRRGPVELSVLPGGPLRRPEPGHGQHDRAQARPAVPRVRGGAAADLRATQASPRVRTSTSMRPTSRSPRRSRTRASRACR